MSARKLKVFGTGLITKFGVRRAIVAVTSKTAACKLFKRSRGYVCETGNKVQIEAALAQPGVILFEYREWHASKPEDWVRREELKV